MPWIFGWIFPPVFPREKGTKNPPKNPPQNSPRTLFGKTPLGFLQNQCHAEGGATKGGVSKCEQTRANADKRGQTWTNASKRRGEKRKQTQANTSKRGQTQTNAYTPLYCSFLHPPLHSPYRSLFLIRCFRDSRRFRESHSVANHRFREAPDTLDCRRHIMRAILSVKPKCSHMTRLSKGNPSRNLCRSSSTQPKTQPSKPP